ncbi:MAG: DUF4124 domain-containing protein [Wenzhouxiangella sp.]
MMISRSVYRCLCIAAALLLTANLAAQPIYKVRDADGNIIYTDQKPSEDAEPMALPELGIMDEDGAILDQALGDPRAIDPALDPQVEPLQLLIAHPQDGMQFSLSGGGVPVELFSNIELPPSAQIVLFVNEQAQEPIHQFDIVLTGLDAGSYRLRAELQSPSGRILAHTEEVSFSLRAGTELRIVQ